MFIFISYLFRGILRVCLVFFVSLGVFRCFLCLFSSRFAGVFSVFLCATGWPQLVIVETRGANTGGWGFDNELSWPSEACWLAGQPGTAGSLSTAVPLGISPPSEQSGLGCRVFFLVGGVCLRLVFFLTNKPKKPVVPDAWASFFVILFDGFPRLRGGR